jgi:hypothetical protein
MTRQIFRLSWFAPIVLHTCLQALASQQPAHSKDQEAICGSPNSCKHEFHETLMGLGQAGDGTLLDVRTFETNSGVKLTTVHGHFASSSAATAELQRRTSKASKILEKGERKAYGLSVGQRVVAITSPLEGAAERATVFLTEGPEFYEIISPSMQLVLEFEARYYSLKREDRKSKNGG